MQINDVTPSDPLLTPFTLGKVELRNRIVSTSHAPHYAVSGLPLEQYRLYHEEKAKGGIALTMIGGSSSVDTDSPYLPGYLDFSTDRIIEPLRQLTDAVHAQGCAVMSQITHRGRRQRWDVDPWLPLLSSSSLREPEHRSFGKAMEPLDITRVTRAFAAAARRGQEAGLDGIEVSAYSDHLLEQFLSPVANRRDDDYGGSLAARVRFLQEVLIAIRSEVGSDFLVGVRLAVEEGVPEGGITLGEGTAIVSEVDAWGLADFLSLTVGSGMTDQGLTVMIPEMGKPIAPYLKTIREATRDLSLPVMHAARIPDLETARFAIENGYVDLVGMTRAHIADPHLVSKLTRGEASRVRPCVGAAYCINRTIAGQGALCLHNPSTGREAFIPQVVPTSTAGKYVVVVGGGPAGLEAARACAESGHRVSLFEAGARLGGQVVLASRGSAHRAELIGIVDWLEQEARHLGVDIHVGEVAGGAEVLALAPDVVVVATGGYPNMEVGGEVTEVACSAWDVLGGHVRPAGRTLLYDDQGQEEGLTVAEALFRGGAEVIVVTPDRAIGQDVVGVTHSQFLETLYAASVQLKTDHRLIELQRGAAGSVSVQLQNVYTEVMTTVEVDQVVLVQGTFPEADLYSELVTGSSNGGAVDLLQWANGTHPESRERDDGSYLLYRIGDAAVRRNIHAAIYDGRRVAMSILEEAPR